VRWLTVAMTALLAPSFLWAQIFVVRDDRWAATEPAARALVNRQGENAERWLRRMRLPYRRLNASELRNGADGFFVLPANRPTPDLLAKLRNAQRVVLFAFVGEQTEGWLQALGIAERSPLIRRNGWVIVTQPFPDGLPDGEKAKGLASWLLDGANLPLPLRTLCGSAGGSGIVRFRQSERLGFRTSPVALSAGKSAVVKPFHFCSRLSHRCRLHQVPTEGHGFNGYSN